MQHGICHFYSQRFNRNRNFLKLITIQKPMDMAQMYKPKNPPPIEELVRVIVFTAASLSIMGFPF